MKTPSLRVDQLRLRDLSLLDHLAQTGSLRITAQRLHVTQPAVTQALKVLEQAFGMALVQRGQRGQRGVSLTPAGQAALVRLRVAREEVLAAQRAASSPQVTTLRVGVLPVAMFHVLPRVLVRLREAMPQVHVELLESTVSGLWQALADGKIDAMVGLFPSPGEYSALPQGVAYRQLAQGGAPLVIAASRSRRESAGTKPTLQWLARQHWVLPPPGAFTRMSFDQMFVRAGLTPPPAAISSSSFYSNLQMAAASELLTVAPEPAVRTFGQALKLKIVEAPWGEQDSGVVLAVRDFSQLHPALQAFQDCFRDL